MLAKITVSLRSIQSCGAFASRSTATPENLRLEIEGVGRVRLPVSATMARKLLRVAYPAPYGVRDRTLLDKSVRDTWAVARSRLKVDKGRWKQTLAPQLETVRTNGEIAGLAR